MKSTFFVNAWKLNIIAYIHFRILKVYSKRVSRELQGLFTKNCGEVFNCKYRETQLVIWKKKNLLNSDSNCKD